MIPPVDEAADLPQQVPLAEPRPLTSGERALLDALVEPLGLAMLSEQAARAEVVAKCSCGCPSVGLRTTGPQLADEVVTRLDAVGRDDVCAITAWGVNPQGREVEVTLHVVSGRMEELEIWAGWDGSEVGTELPIRDVSRATSQPLCGPGTFGRHEEPWRQSCRRHRAKRTNERPWVRDAAFEPLLDQRDRSTLDAPKPVRRECRVGGPTTLCASAAPFRAKRNSEPLSVPLLA